MFYFLVLALLFSPQAAQPVKPSISGIVTDSVTGRPLSKTVIMLQPVDVPGRPNFNMMATTSDAEGRFEMIDLTPGVYFLKARRSGYLETAYGARLPGENGSRVRLEAGQALRGIEFKIPPASAISGTVRDNDGEPLENAPVILAHFEFQEGISKFSRMSSTGTDERGEYHFHGLAPGSYYIGVQTTNSANWGTADHSRNSGPIEMPIATLYPGVSDVNFATPLKLSAGQRATGIDVTLIRSRVYHVRGRILNPPKGRLVSLTLHDPANAGLRDLLTSTKDDSGNFEFRAVPPGSYTLSTVADSVNCSTPVQVASADIDDLRVTLEPGATIERLTLVTDNPQNKEIPALSMRFVGPSAGYTVDNSWGLGSVPPDRYNVFRFYGGTLRQYYVKSAKAGETDLLASGLTVPAAATVRIAITLASDGAAVEGLVRDSNGQPIPGATIVLVPDRRATTYLFQDTTSDQRGHFEIPAITPGDYKIFAWDDAPRDAWYQSDFLKQFEKQAQPLTLDPKAHKSLDLRLITQPDSQ